MADVDPRLTPVRPDLAAAHLKGKIAAPRYVDGTLREAAAPAAPLRRAPQLDARLDTELLFGERFTVYDEREGWAWGQAALDDYVGYVPARALAAPGPPATHRVTALRTYLYPVADVKAPPLALLSMNAKLVVIGGGGKLGLCRFEGTTAYVFREHLAPLASQADDFVAVAEAFVGTPYLWGGRQSLGIDCSGLVQAALERAGIAAPRDTDLQERTLGTFLPDGATLRRGDLVFWKGHVGIMRDATHMVHANATRMAVTVDPVALFAEQVKTDAGPITGIKRLA